MSQNNYPMPSSPIDQQEPIASPQKSKSPYVLFIAVAVICLIIIIVLIVVASLQQTSEPPSQQDTQTQETNPQSVAFTVGNEEIYQQDLQTELQRYPEDQRAELQDRIIEKMREDTIILQGAAEDGIIELDDIIYNSPQKDYAKRLETLRYIKETIENEKVAAIEGYVVSIWPHNSAPGPIGYEEGRKIAREKIDELHTLVSSGEITMVEAGERIQEDEELAQIDINYRGNAIFAFRATAEDQITGDPVFNDLLRELDEGEVTEVYASESPNTNGDEVIWYYRFGQVTKNIINSNAASYEEWLLQKKQSIQ